MSGSARGRSMMSSRRRKRSGGPFFVFLLLVAAAAVTWWLWPEPGALDTPELVEAAASEPAAAAAQPPPVVEFRPQREEAVTPPPVPVAVHHAAPQPAAVEEPAPRPPTRPSVLDAAASLIRAGDVVEARAVLSEALRSRELRETEAEQVRGTLAVLNNGMVFGPEVTPGDPFTRLYEIKSGDALSRIANREGIKTNWRFLQRINGIADPGRIRAGQRIKVVQGPFHAEVDKKAHRIDIWLGEGEEAVFVRSLPVGLGEFDSTPQGGFRVRRGGKMVNPSWTNPRTGERFAAADPNNPIGEFWIGLDGIDPHNLQEQGFGIHGTIEPDSIGQDRSMGCVRLADGDIDLLYEMLTEGNSVVLVRE
jgi:lipoprotein-anchoring transpeptidase ErfK/SrfK